MNKGHVVKAAMVALAVLVGSSGTAQAASQTWYLDFNGTVSSEAIRGSPPEQWQTSIADGGLYYWFEPNANTANVNLADDLWTYSLRLVTHATGSFKLHVGKGAVANGEAVPASFQSFHEVTVATFGTATLYTGSLVHNASAGDFWIHQGEHLMFALENVPDGDQGSKQANQRRTVIVQTGDEASWFASPASDPGIPTPELPTVLLMAAGVGLFAFVALRRKA
ncbi:MAG TPA: hypothetical protein VM889_02080 [Candidatus Thermoplasmatota archaeon]|nr:hypothetical protein [Candidatus Thermoplasmatota archaeon]